MDAATPSTVTSRWGTPDPRDADAYPKATSSTPMTQWAWEFLRRRSDYRIAWEKHVQPFLNGHGGFDQAAIERHQEETLNRAIQEQCGHRWRGPWKARQELVMRRPWEETSASQEQRGYRCPDPSIALQDRFRVSGLSQFCNFTLDPRLERPPVFDGTNIKEVAKHTDFVKPPKVLLEFDLQLPFDTQLENARKHLTLRRQWLHGSAQHNKPQIDKFPSYLRLLDFQDEHAPDKEIGTHLFPNYSGDNLRDRIRKTDAAARRWQDDYLIIALHRSDAS